jgi:hypothetical protein
MYIEAVKSWTNEKVDNNGPNSTIYLIFLTHSDVKSFYLIQANFISSWLVDYVNKGTRDYGRLSKYREITRVYSMI